VHGGDGVNWFILSVGDGVNSFTLSGRDVNRESLFIVPGGNGVINSFILLGGDGVNWFIMSGGDGVINKLIHSARW